MKKICIVCNTEFDSTHAKGSEQKYCSNICRTSAAQQRQKEKIIQEYEIEKAKSNGTSPSENIGRVFDENSGTRENTGRHIDDLRNDNIINTKASSGNNYFFDLIERNYQTQNESNINKLKLELALKEIDQLTTRCSILENELDELDEMDAVSGLPQNEYLAGIVQQFKTDPQGTITMVKELIPLIPDIIGSFFKPKAA
jgi:predicted nucleic acid-binding Zn ribbon protein